MKLLFFSIGQEHNVFLSSTTSPPITPGVTERKPLLLTP